MASGGGAWRFIGTPSARGIRSRENTWASRDHRPDCRLLTIDYFCVSARKTRSPTGTLRVKSVGVVTLETPTA